MFLCPSKEAPFFKLNRLTPIKCRKEAIKGVSSAAVVSQGDQGDWTDLQRPLLVRGGAVF